MTTATAPAAQGRTSDWAQEDRKATEVPDGPKWRGDPLHRLVTTGAATDEERDQCCFSGEESGQGGATDKPLINEKKPTL